MSLGREARRERWPVRHGPTRRPSPRKPRAGPKVAPEPGWDDTWWPEKHELVLQGLFWIWAVSCFFTDLGFTKPGVAGVLAALTASVILGLLFCREFGLSTASQMGGIGAVWLAIDAGSLWRWEALAAAGLAGVSYAAAGTLSSWAGFVRLPARFAHGTLRQPAFPRLRKWLNQG